MAMACWRDDLIGDADCAATLGRRLSAWRIWPSSRM